MADEIPLHKERLNPADKDKIKKSQDDLREKLRLDMAQAFGSAEGLRALTFIMDLCGHNKTVIGGNPTIGMDLAMGTIHNAARHNVYLELRAFIPKHILKKVEFGDIIEIS